jgi:hypothetical protein
MDKKEIRTVEVYFNIGHGMELIFDMNANPYLRIGNNTIRLSPNEIYEIANNMIEAVKAASTHHDLSRNPKNLLLNKTLP